MSPTAGIKRSLILGAVAAGIGWWAAARPAAGQSAAGSPREEAEQLFTKGTERLQKGDYPLARMAFQDILKYHADDDLQEAALLLVAYCLYRQQDYATAQTQLKNFLKKYPDSPQADYARFLLGKVFYRQDKKAQSLEVFSLLLQKGKDPAVIKRTKSLFTGITIPEEGAFDYAQLAALYERPEKVKIKKDVLKLGLICPLTRDYTEIGEAVLKGAMFAVSEYNKTHKRKIQLIVEDSQGDLIRAIGGARKLIETDEVLAIIGPILSNPVIAVAALANEHRVPLVTPTASRYGIAALGEYIYQTNVPSLVQGQLVAEFAVKQLQFETFAILAPFDSYGKGMVLGFEEAIQQLGATVVSREWYYEGAMDFSAQLQKIRRRELIKTLNLMDVKENTDVEGLARGEDNPDSKLLVPIPSIDAVFVPSYLEEVPLIASQVAFNNIETILLGGDKWNHADILKQKQYIERAVFPGIIYKDRSDKRFQDFIQRYRVKYGDSPEDVTLLVYDGMQLVINSLAKGAESRQQIQKDLTATREFQGVTRRLYFPEGKRYNQQLDFLMVRNGEIKRYDPKLYQPEDER